MIIGITGQTATGKSSLAQAFKKSGYIVFDADKEYKQLLEIDVELQSELKNKFGTIDRKILLQKVLNDSTLLGKLNEITHKYVFRELLAFLDTNKNKQLLLDVPIPSEKEFIEICDKIIVTVCDIELQKKRLMERYDISSLQAEDRIKMQMCFENYIKIANIVLNTQKTDENDLLTFVRIFENTCLDRIRIDF